MEKALSNISQGTVVKGEIISDGDIRVDGEVEGRIDSEGKVLFGESARMTGNIDAADVEFYGHIDGDMTVRNTLSLKSSACVNGDIHIRKLQVELGAQFNGACHMLNTNL